MYFTKENYILRNMFSQFRKRWNNENDDKNRFSSETEYGTNVYMGVQAQGKGDEYFLKFQFWHFLTVF